MATYEINEIRAYEDRPTKFEVRRDGAFVAWFNSRQEAEDQVADAIEAASKGER